MTESLLQQARELRLSYSHESNRELKQFLDSVIEHLEISCPNLARLGTLTPTGQLERTHTLAIMAAVIWSNNGDSSERACIDAEALLAQVEERQR